ncbi:hypothetical protein TWF106_002804 [Orbilia oligospora]|uniref:Uncharacterized protein n=1 Tax=Orbilia oligospora TaxID=2813651 RepID=A0A6G1M0Q5_ORBOL|nr:hypothetical protein TWF788_001105 [Orbilia oligospora]KAF3201520.1 hypothetical protein TWF106_002804 [Orbilia oligospora]KAF3205289.1 hypothetical protein TWF191_001907 [Orbilia oligospora]KAF3213846.1 hypothetical protein TWF679_005164 [Orbilia oligospora]KAF3241206.1 hypothetical protein TWF192_009214 [Orbilia oligospora]
MSSDIGQTIEAASLDTMSPEGHVQVIPEPQNPTGAPVLIAERTSDDRLIQGLQEYEKQSMDTQPNVSKGGEDTTLTNGHQNPNATLPTSPTDWSGLPAPGPPESDISIPHPPSTNPVQETASENSAGPVEGTLDEANDNTFDDDFDDFGETVEDGDGFDDFGDFDNATMVAEVESDSVESIQDPPSSSLLDFTKMTSDEMRVRIDDIVSSIYLQENNNAGGVPAPLPTTNSAFLTERSQSLWTQLCTPPPLQPPNWKLSRIRRLFLVSLGVPVDLDEILPADTKQKKLVLPSSSHTRKSSDTNRGDGDRSNRSSSRRRKEKEAQSKLVDMPSARILCSTSDVRLRAFTVSELEEHVKKLEEVTREASETLTYWLGKRETALGDKEAFERVIENLVEFAKKKR